MISFSFYKTSNFGSILTYKY